MLKTKMNHELLSGLYQQTFTSSKSIIETQVKHSRSKVINKDTGTALFQFRLKSENLGLSDEFRDNLNELVLVSLLLALNIFHTFF